MRHDLATFLKSSFVRVSFAVVTLALPLAARADRIEPGFGDGPSPDMIFVRNIAHAGSGCPAGTVAVDMPTDSYGLVVVWDSLTASLGQGIPFTERRKNCALSIDVAYPSGWQYAVDRVALHGFAHLDPGVTGTVQSTYYFQGQAQTAAFTTNFRGPDADYFEFYDDASTRSVWSPCGARRALNLNFSVRATSQDRYAEGLIGIEGISFLKLKWRRC